MVLSALVRGLAVLQRYPLPLLLPLLVIAATGVGVNHLVAGLTLTKFAHFLVFVAGLLIRYLLACAGFLCVANYTVRSEANGERPEVSNLLDSLAFPGCVKLLTGLLARFAAALVVAGAVTIILSTSALRVFKATTRHPVPRLVSGEVYLWIAIVLAILVLSRWLLAIPLFVQSKGLLKSPLALSVQTIRGRRGFAVAFTLLVVALSFPLVRLTSPLHPQFSDGATRYVPQFLEILAAHGFAAVLWTWWMMVITLLTMRLQGHDEPLPATPLAVA